MVELSQQGVPPPVLDYMQQTYLEAVRVDAAYDAWWHWTAYDGFWYGGAPFGWPCEPVYIYHPPPPPPPHPHTEPPEWKEPTRHDRH